MAKYLDGPEWLDLVGWTSSGNHLLIFNEKERRKCFCKLLVELRLLLCFSLNEQNNKNKKLGFTFQFQFLNFEFFIVLRT